MDFLELAKNRFSLRKFSDKKVEKEKIDYILAAMQAAPTAVNFQPQRILVLNIAICSYPRIALCRQKVSGFSVMWKIQENTRGMKSFSFI